MYLDFDGNKIRVDVKDESSSPSKHTGTPLRHLKVQTVIRGQSQNERFLSLLEKAKTESVTSIDENGNITGKWKVGNTSWSYTEGRPFYSHTLDIDEIEELHLDSLVLGELTIKPYAYEEEFRGDSLSIDAKALLSEDQHTKLKTMLESRDYFEVIRHGINEQPMEMRFGICYWSKHDEGIKHQIYLVEKTIDETPSPMQAAFRWMRPMRNQVAENKGSIEALLNILLNKGVLTSEEIEHIRSDTTKRHWDIIMEFFKVDDIDKLIDLPPTSERT